MHRRHRLTSSRDFARVMRTGKRGSSGPITVTIAAGEHDRPARVGISARLREGGSVRRNRAKRLVREAIRGHLTALPPGTDVVVTARDGTPGSSFQDVEGALVDALRKAGFPC